MLQRSTLYLSVTEGILPQWHTEKELYFLEFYMVQATAQMFIFTKVSIQTIGILLYKQNILAIDNNDSHVSNVGNI